MIGGRIFAAVLAAVIFFLQGGDCVTMFVKSKQTHDCCNKGHCSRTNPDPCCQISARTDIAKDQVKQKTALPELVAIPVVAVWTPSTVAPMFLWDRHRPAFAPSPPGQLGNFRLPLLV